MQHVCVRVCLWWMVLCSVLWSTSPLLYAQNNGLSDIALARYAGGFDKPVHITHAGDGSQRLFVVEQEGIIRIVKNATLLSQPFLNISARVSCCGEQGLLSVAFPPGYANKGYFYVNYTNNDGNTVIARYRVTSDPDVANPNSEQIILTITQPFANHNGGQIAFGPDGFLYIGMGDGGSAGDPQNNGQRPDTLLGKLLRIDVESGAAPYAVPPTNPFFQNRTYQREVWAFGFRNPWRFSFDRRTGDLYIGDVGQGSREEIDVQPNSSPGGENYGWRIMEGSRCFESNTCSQSGLTLPVVEYDHSDGCSVTGGVVYRGQQFSSLQGVYFYGDYCSGIIWALKLTASTRQTKRLLDTSYTISTFGEDEAGEIYLADYSGGVIYRITDINAPSGADLRVTVSDAPDPVTVNTNLTYSLSVTNDGPSSTDEVRISTTLPAGVNFVSATTSQGSCSGNATVTCQLNTLGSGVTATVTVIVTPTATGGLSLAATVSGKESDPTTNNNSATAVTTVSANQPSPPSPPPTPPTPPTEGPDFTGTWQSVSQSCKGSGAAQKCKLRGTFVVQNQGTQNAASAPIQFYLSQNGTFEAGDPFIASTTTSALKRGKRKSRKLKVTLPTGSNASGWFVIAVIDEAQRVAEQNESNNSVNSGPIQ